MGKRTISISDGEWNLLVQGAQREGIRQGRIVSVSEFIRIILSRAKPERRADAEDVRPAFPLPERSIVRAVSKSDQTRRKG